MLFLTKSFYFCAAHQYGHDNWSKKKNLAVFGKDAKVHGHNYIVDITIKGEINPQTGFIVELEHLKSIINEHVIDILDHVQIEKDIPWFQDKQPSSENLVMFIWQMIQPRLEGVQLHRVRLIETPTIKTDYYG